MSAIKKGDMVRLVWGCCSRTRAHIGEIGTVSAVLADGWVECWRCGYHREVIQRIDMGRDGYVPAAWLIKIEPPGEPESTEETKELTV